MTKIQQTIEHVVVTFFEAGIAYVTVNQTHISTQSKAVAIGAFGAGLSAVYNLLRQSKPTVTYPKAGNVWSGTVTGMGVSGTVTTGTNTIVWPDEPKPTPPTL